MRIVRCHLDRLLQERDMTLTELSRRTGITQANLSILKNNKSKAIRWSSLLSLTEALGGDVQPGDLFTIEEAPD